MSGKGGNGRIDFWKLRIGDRVGTRDPSYVNNLLWVEGRGLWRGWPRFVTVKISISMNLRWNGRNWMCISFLFIRLFRLKSSSFRSEIKNCFFRRRGIGQAESKRVRSSRKLADLANICRPGELPLRYESLKDWPSVMPTVLEYSFLFMHMCISSPVGSFQWHYSNTKT